MLKSMTGYGEGNVRSSFGKIRIELKSVNHRFLDSRISLPRELSYLEPEFKAEIRKKLKRGMVFLNLYWEKSGSGLGELKLNIELVQSLERNFKKLQRRLKDPARIGEAILLGVPAELIVNFPGVLYFSASPERQRKAGMFIRKALKKALDNLIKSRKEEGRQLEKDIRSRLGFINKEISRIKEFLPGYRNKLKRRIKEKLKQFQMEKGINQERLRKEVAFVLIRSDFTEEIIRIESHLQSLSKLISKEASGKNIDFFLQELNREINTLNDKASEINISRSAIRIKAELEKLREQALNLE